MIEQLINNAMQVPEDLAMILNDSSLFSNSADITTKEILKRYSDRAKAPTVNSPAVNASRNDMYGDMSSPTPQSSNREGVTVERRGDTEPNRATAWQNESSGRHVGSDLGTPNIPYANLRNSQDSHGSPNRASMRSPAWDRRTAGMA